jgi:hypothetical protein
MKKIAGTLLIGLLVSTAAFADHPKDKWGLGPVNGFSVGADDWYGSLGLSLKAPVLPIFWGIYANLATWGIGGGLTGDFYIFDRSMVDTQTANEEGTYHLKLDWYLGIGGFVDLLMWGDYAFFDAGARIPTGVSWHINESLELSVGIAPSFGVNNWSEDYRFHFAVPMEISFRFWRL